MGGEMALISEESQGSAFSFTLPVGVAHGANVAIEARPQELAGRDVLIVDRHAASRDVLAGWLRAWGATVTCAADTGAVTALLWERRWGLVLIDRESLDTARHDVEAITRVGVPVVDLVLASEATSAGTSPLSQGTGLAKPLRRPTVAAVLAAALSRVLAEANGHPAQSATSLTAVPRVTRAPKILAADDNALNLRIVTELLEGRGCSVVVAANGREAVDAWHRERFDLVLMDVQMPDLDGLEACRRIRDVETRRRVRRTPIVALTAHAMAGDRERCLAAGMDDYIAKPLRRTVLYEVMDRFGIAMTALDKPA
jgi:CheY-like chemotaxis protein